MATDEQMAEFFKENSQELGSLVFDLAAKGLSLKDLTEEIERYIEERLAGLKS